MSLGERARFGVTTPASSLARAVCVSVCRSRSVGRSVGEGNFLFLWRLRRGGASAANQPGLRPAATGNRPTALPPSPSTEGRSFLIARGDRGFLREAIARDDHRRRWEWSHQESPKIGVSSSYGGRPTGRPATTASKPLRIAESRRKEEE